ncbi:MAG TPA: DUF995 domain-containing protein [Alphaproteobacteria bacterium]|jgi:hypothetical protein|nr:DUF995 domain-containing protein [Alphaproteobacteria bacterium]HJM51068.1 DUF995 domain-containing protein [Alphaproteobacteria bacterium]|tara:strand:- start:925 stop:1389 length:465 start_codon:yes stop_codon:yes gene_type:complete
MTLSKAILFGLTLIASTILGVQITFASAWSDCEIVTGVPVPSKKNALTSSDVKKLLSGKTMKWTYGAGYYAPDGTLEFVWKGNSGSGWWRVVEGGVDCLKVPDWWGNEEKCDFRNYRVGENIVIVNVKTVSSTTDFQKPKSKSPGCYKEGKNLQ